MAFDSRHTHLTHNKIMYTRTKDGTPVLRVEVLAHCGVPAEKWLADTNPAVETTGLDPLTEEDLQFFNILEVLQDGWVRRLAVIVTEAPAKWVVVDESSDYAKAIKHFRF